MFFLRGLLGLGWLRDVFQILDFRSRSSDCTECEKYFFLIFYLIEDHGRESQTQMQPSSIWLTLTDLSNASLQTCGVVRLVSRMCSWFSFPHSLDKLVRRSSQRAKRLHKTSSICRSLSWRQTASTLRLRHRIRFQDKVSRTTLVWTHKDKIR